MSRFGGFVKTYNTKCNNGQSKENEMAGTSEDRPICKENVQKTCSTLLSEDLTAQWSTCIQLWYPHLHEKSYFLPPLHFNRLPCYAQTLAGKNIIIPNRGEADTSQTNSSKKCKKRSRTTEKTPRIVGEHNVREDRAQARVLHCLHALSDNEVMMVISQLNFGKYLHKKSYASAAELFPLPAGLEDSYRQGDFDVLIIHSKYGFITIEIKSVGANFKFLNRTRDNEDETVLKMVKKSVEQLNKSEVVLKHLASDLMTVHVIKTLAMPNIKSDQFRRVLEGHTDELTECLGTKTVDEANDMCLLFEQLQSDDYESCEINPALQGKLKKWWERVTSTAKYEMSDKPKLYENLISRFCGPATTVEIHCISGPRLELRTEGEGVSETGERMTRLVLFPDQVELLNVSPPRVFLNGPPGTGKTVVLIMQGLQWLQCGHTVHIVSTWDGSLAATFCIEHQLKESLMNGGYSHSESAVKCLEICCYDFLKKRGVETAVCELSGKQMPLYILLDEAITSKYRLFIQFCDNLTSLRPDVCLWASAVHNDIRPQSLENFTLQAPLRSPPVVIREIESAHQMKDNRIHRYLSNGEIPAPTDGPAVKRIQHRSGQAEHEGHWPDNCCQCGREIAYTIIELRVHQKISDQEHNDKTAKPPTLQFSDFIVLCDDPQPFGLVRGLLEKNVPVLVVKSKDKQAIIDMAHGKGDSVIVTHMDVVRGLEKKIVIVVPVWADSEIYDRLHSMSRCSSQLILIDWKPAEADSVYDVSNGDDTIDESTVNIPRFISPYIEVNQESSLARKTSESFAKIIQLRLSVDQVHLLKLFQTRVFITGPPGTGKTVVLVLKGFKWLQLGRDVLVVSTWDLSRAVSIIIEQQLLWMQRAMLPPLPKVNFRVSRCHYNFAMMANVEQAVNDLSSSVRNGDTLCIIADEVNCSRYRNFTSFCDWLIEKVPKVRIWASATQQDIRPPCLKLCQLTQPLRSLPAIVKEIQGSQHIRVGRVLNYSSIDVRPPSDPTISHIHHIDGHANHTGRWPESCIQCGREIACHLTTLHVGPYGQGSSTFCYREVVVLCDNPCDERKDDAGNITSEASGLVHGLRECCVPLHVVEGSDEAAIRDMALNVYDKVTVTHMDNVRGLEWKVVFVAPYWADKNVYDSLHAASRCSSHLIWINWSKKAAAEEISNSPS